MDEIKLSQWAKENGKTYKQAWSMVKEGAFPEKTIETKSGRIMVLRESKASQTKKVELGTPLFADYKETKASDIRRNRATTISKTDEYANIESGLDIYRTGRNGKDDSSIDVSEAIRLVRLCYYNFADLSQIIDTLTDFSTSPIYYRGGNAKSRRFFENLFNKINIMNFQQKFFLEYYRSCNVFPYRFETVLKDEDISNLNKVYGAKAAKKIKLPTKYIIINPESIIYGGNINFASPLFYQRLNPYEVQRLIKPITQEDRDFLESLPEEVRKQLNKKSGIASQEIDIPLSPEYVYFIFYRKADYEAMCRPLAWPAIKDINAKQELKNLDQATARTVMRAVLHIAIGFENKNGEIFIDQKAMEATRALFSSESLGKILVTDFTTKVEWKVPPIEKLLGQEKYKQLNEDIRNSLVNILSGTGEEKFANQSIKVKLFIQRLKQSRETFINEFLQPEIKRISQLMGFKSYPQAYFQDIDFRDVDLWQRIVLQLSGFGLLSAEETFRALEDGILPDAETSEESQRKFKKLKDEGLYQSVQGNPSTQLEVLSEQNKQAMKVMDKQQEFDSKEKGKDRKHAAENPQAPAPQIVLNAPTKMAQPKGKPAGSRSTSPVKKKVKPISASLIKENLILATQANQELEKQVLKKFKVKSLTPEQIQLKDTLLDSILASENPGDWSKKEVIASYVSNPDKINEEKYEQVRQICEEHQVNDYLGSIILNSQGAEIEDEPAQE